MLLFSTSRSSKKGMQSPVTSEDLHLLVKVWHAEYLEFVTLLFQRMNSFFGRGGVTWLRKRD